MFGKCPENGSFLMHLLRVLSDAADATWKRIIETENLKEIEAEKKIEAENFTYEY